MEDSKRYILKIFISPDFTKDPREVDDNLLINASSCIA